MRHPTIHTFEDPKLEPIRALITEFEAVESATTPLQRQQLVARGRQWGLGQTPDRDVSVPPPLQAYADKCARFAYKVYDEEVEALEASGVTQTEIVEVTLAANLGVSLARLERGLSLLAEEGER